MYKNKGITYSQFMLEYLSNNLEDEWRVAVDTFYNCREQGYCLSVYSKEYTKSLTIWLYAQRNSDEPTITYKKGVSYNEEGNRFDEDSWLKRTKSYSDIFEASRELVKLIKKELESDKDE